MMGGEKTRRVRLVKTMQVMGVGVAAFFSILKILPMFPIITS